MNTNVSPTDIVPVLAIDVLTIDFRVKPEVGIRKSITYEMSLCVTSKVKHGITIITPQLSSLPQRPHLHRSTPINTFH